MKVRWKGMEAYVASEFAKGKESVAYYEIIGDMPTRKNKTSFSLEMEDYTELGEALSRFYESMNYGGRGATLFKVTCDGTMDEPKCEVVKEWRNKDF